MWKMESPWRTAIRCKRRDDYDLSPPRRALPTVAERPYQRRPQRAIILSDEVWNTHIRQFFNVLGKQDTGFLRLTLRQHRADNHRFTQITRAGWPLADIGVVRIITEWRGR